MISIKDIIQSSSNHFTGYHFIATKTFFNKKNKILKDFIKEKNCIKSVRIRSYSGLHFFRIRTE